MRTCRHCCRCRWSWNLSPICQYWQHTILFSQKWQMVNVVNSHFYLSVTASGDLYWHKHVNNISAKATKTLNFICHNVYCCPPDTKATAYISLVRLHLEYAAAAWDAYLVVDCKQLKKVQHRATHFAKQDYRSTTLVSSLISQLDWQTLSDRRRNSRLSLMYKSLHGLAGISASHLFVVLSSPPVQLMATHFVPCLL